MGAKVFIVVKIPISEIEVWIRSKYDLPGVLEEFRIEEKDLVLHFAEKEEIETKSAEDVPLPKATNATRRRAHRKRNRMKTRGWRITARITNSKGQKCTIYEPFVNALEDSRLTYELQKKAVEEILKSNRNKPAEESIQYFLENTLEYLKGVQ
jgi:hypothetical protein